jgi:vacuolar-type H+-ATPase subunit H
MTDLTASAEQDKGLDHLERQSEKHRAEFARTVDELRHRISPKTLQAGLKRRTSRLGKGILADLEQKVLDNPLQAAAVGAGLAYPVWRILQSLPVPILFIGAGVALAGRGSEAEGGHASALSGTHTTSSSAPRLANELASHVTETGKRAVSTASHYASSRYQAAAEGTTGAAQQVADAGRAGRESVSDMIERYPLVASGVGLLLGAALAACLPPSRTERRLLGETSDRLKDQARETATRALSEATAAGERIVEKTLDKAQEQGLTPSDAQRAMRKAGDSAQAVVDSASRAALDQESASPAGKSASENNSKQGDS